MGTIQTNSILANQHLNQFLQIHVKKTKEKLPLTFKLHFRTLSVSTELLFSHVNVDVL